MTAVAAPRRPFRRRELTPRQPRSANRPALSAPTPPKRVNLDGLRVHWSLALDAAERALVAIERAGLLPALETQRCRQSLNEERRWLERFAA